MVAAKITADRAAAGVIGKITHDFTGIFAKTAKRTADRAATGVIGITHDFIFAKMVAQIAAASAKRAAFEKDFVELGPAAAMGALFNGIIPPADAEHMK